MNLVLIYKGLQNIQDYTYTSNPYLLYTQPKMKFNLFNRKKRFTCGCRKNFNTEEELTKHGQIEHSEKYQEQNTL
jgi:hypothetical protein